MGSEGEKHFALPTSPERRAHDRYRVHLNVMLTSAALHERAWMTRDFCVGGLFLSCGAGLGRAKSSHISRLVTNDVVEISCTVNESGISRELSFQGQVVRRCREGIAVRFVNPDLTELQVLLDYAKALGPDPRSTPRAHGDSKAPLQTRINGRTYQELLSVCDRTVEDILGNLMASFNETIAESLFEAAKETADIGEQNAFFGALNVINTNRDSARASFVSTVRRELQNRSLDSAPDLQRDKREFTYGHLTVVEDETFDDWLADKATIGSIETQHKETLAELTQRLSVIFGVEIKNENNPYGPALFAKTFRETIKPLGMSHKVNLCCYQVFRGVLLKALGALYSTLNEKLIAKEILPIITYKVEKPAVEPTSPEKLALPSVPDRTTAAVADTQEHGRRGSPKDARPDKVHDIFDLLGRLQNLQRNTAGHAATSIKTDHVHAGPKEAFASNASDSQPVRSLGEEPVCYSPRELTDALARLSPISPSRENAGHARDYKSEVLKVLGADQNGVGCTNVGARESTIMDVAGSVFHSMATDIHVSEKVRGWIQRLELPVLKVALLNDSLFRDKSHPLRQVINKISELEVFAGEADETNEPAVRNAIEWIINLVNTECDGSPEVYLRAVRALNLLLKVQEKAYSDNLRYVVEEAERRENNLEHDSRQAEPEIPVDWGDVSANDRTSWLKRVRRLTAGDWIVLDAASVSPRRLRIGWISPGTRKFVLVNLSGMKEKEMHAEGLAKALYDRSATLLESADEPAMDRAQYAILQDLHSKLLHQSTHDQLTGLINRREFEKRLEHARVSAKQHNDQHTVCFIDLDRFSTINNACGYEGGDKLLKEVSGLLKNRLDEHSVLARIGSDEFGLLLDNCTLDAATDFVEQHWNEIQEYRLVWDDKRLSIGASIGLVPVTNCSKDIGNVLQAAESSCSIAKDKGGNRIEVFGRDYECSSRRSDALKWAAEIDRILDDETLYLRCQKIMPIAESNREYSHYEVLLGVWDAHGGIISTPEFIQAAERYHRMPEVDRWIITKVFRWMRSNRDRLHDTGGFSINLSGRSLNEDGFLQFIKDAIESTGVPTDKVCFEITETVGVASLSDASEFIREIKKTGCKFSLDDFGSGMSSYAYLRNLPVDFLKIDGAFVKDMANNPCDSAVVKSICEIGHFMNKKVIAEYAQNDAILEHLRALGVDYAQGYAVAKPIPMDDLGSAPCDDRMQ